MISTTYLEGSLTLSRNGHPVPHCPEELLNRYDRLLSDRRLNWTEHLHLKKLLGSGGQGVVYLSERRGADGFTLPVALKIFSPKSYEDTRGYEEAMGRIARMAARVAQSPHSRGRVFSLTPASVARRSRSSGLSLKRKLLTAAVTSPSSTR